MALPILISDSEALKYIGKTSPTNAELELVSILRPLVDRAVRAEIQSGVTQDTYTHYLPRAVNEFPVRGIRTPYVSVQPSVITLPEFPVRSVTSVHEDSGAYGGSGSNPWASTDELTEGTDFYVDWDQSGISSSGMLIRLSGSGWCTTPGSIKIVYTAGWAESELSGTPTDYNLDASDIRLAAMITFKDAFDRATQITSGVKREKLADYEIEFLEDKSEEKIVTVPKTAKGLLQRFCRVNTLVW